MSTYASHLQEETALIDLGLSCTTCAIRFKKEASKAN
jgi:hypothetical protein